MKQARSESFFKASRLTFIAIPFIAAALVSAEAREKQTVKVGGNACMDFCDKKNASDAGRNKCYGQCGAYWFCNGSDASDPFFVEQCKRYRGLSQQ